MNPMEAALRQVKRARKAGIAGWTQRKFAFPPATAARIFLAPRKRILCYPKQPSTYNALYRICAVSGYEITRHPDQPFDVAVHYAEGGPCSLPADRAVINRRCTNISKTHVANTFAQIFGYALTVDPLTYDGLMVCKSDENFRHDGKILQGPVPADQIQPGRVYQRLIDTLEDGEGVDLRTPIYGGRIPLVYIKRRPEEIRFGSKNRISTIHDAQEIFSAEEIRRLTFMADAMGLDYGEMDVLRDRADGRIYVVDVANTPGGPAKALAGRDPVIAIRRLAGAFQDLVARFEAEGPAAAASGRLPATPATAIV